MRRLVIAAALMLPLCAVAQGPTGILLEPGGAVVNEPVKVVIDFAAAQRWCGLRVDFGDGDVSDVLVQDFPLTIIRRYAAPGRYVVRAEGRLLLRGMASSPACTGAKRNAVITVAESQRDAQPSRGRKADKRESDKREGDKRESDRREDDADSSDVRRPDRPDRPDRKDGKDAKDRKERPERDDRDDRGRSAQDQRAEPGPRGARSREADTLPERAPIPAAKPPERAPAPAAAPPAREPKPAAEPARAPAPPSKPLRDESLKVF